MLTEKKYVPEMTENEAREWGRTHISVPYWTALEIKQAIVQWAKAPQSNTRTAIIAGYWRSLQTVMNKKL